MKNMKKVLVFKGSPRNDGYTARLVDEAVKGEFQGIVEAVSAWAVWGKYAIK
jgi:multimeric flavodoxin WrbA